MRFRVEPRDVPEYAAARRLGLSVERFAEVRSRLFARGFPQPDPDTGNYDLDAIDQWRKLRNRRLFDLVGEPAALDASTVVRARIEARRREMDPGSSPVALDASSGIVQQRIEARRRATPGSRTGGVRSRS